MSWRLSLVAAAFAAALVPVPARIVEHWYSLRIYAQLQPRMTSASNLVPFALLDVVIAIVVALWIILAVKEAVRSGARAFPGIAVRSVVWSAAIYLVFLLAWGGNYRRVKLIEALDVDPVAVTPGAVRAAADLAVTRLNALHDRAHADGWPAADAIDPALSRAFARAVADIGRRPAVVARPKHTFLDWYFRRAAVDGMTDPFFLETLVTADLLPFERPFVVAHEWSHLAGLADEGEASFAGWLTCVRGSASDQYSGWLALYGELAGALGRGDRAHLAAAIADGPRADLQAMRDRVARHVNRRVAAAGWRVYDSYLKANRVEAGAASYGDVVRLVVGARLPNGRRPLG